MATEPSSSKTEQTEPKTSSGKPPTPPTGQGGATPKDRPDYQDQFPPNPEPSDEAKAWGKKIDEVGAVQAHSDAIAEDAKKSK